MAASLAIEKTDSGKKEYSELDSEGDKNMQATEYFSNVGASSRAASNRHTRNLRSRANFIRRERAKLC